VGTEPWILRHYARGGFVGRFVEDSYLWTGRDRTRAFREWRLLAELKSRGLPVPRPVAARVVRRGIAYRADLLTVQIPGAVPLSALLVRGELTFAMLREVGRCIARFHRSGAWHADLNAHNIQIDARGGVHLLDFDRGRLLAPRGAWQRANLRRLRRSLQKVAESSQTPLDPGAWEEVAAGYAC
jgi:3-deoxy-D-manno-octulosonic acid kinase